MSEAITSGGTLSTTYDNLLRTYGVTPGKMQVFRQQELLKDGIEYTVYFRLGEYKYRFDFFETSEALEALGGDAEMFLMGRAMQHIISGNYKLATEYVS